MHDDLSVTINANALAGVYKVAEQNILDHSPQVLDLKKSEGRQQRSWRRSHYHEMIVWRGNLAGN